MTRHAPRSQSTISDSKRPRAPTPMRASIAGSDRGRRPTGASARAVSTPLDARQHRAPVIVAVGSALARLRGGPLLALALIDRLLLFALAVLRVHENLAAGARCRLRNWGRLRSARRRRSGPLAGGPRIRY